MCCLPSGSFEASGEFALLNERSDDNAAVVAAFSHVGEFFWTV